MNLPQDPLISLHLKLCLIRKATNEERTLRSAILLQNRPEMLVGQHQVGLSTDKSLAPRKAYPDIENPMSRGSRVQRRRN